MPEIETAPPAAATPTPPTPPAAPAAETKPTTPAPHPLRDKLLEMLTRTPQAEPAAPKPESAKSEEKKPEAGDAAKASAKPTEKADKPIRRKAKEEPKPAEDLPPPIPKREAAKVEAPAQAPTAAAKPEADDRAFEEGLPEEEKLLLDDAREAEKLLGDKHKGLGQKMSAFLRENAKKAELVDKGELDAEDYKQWYEQQRPKLSALDQRRIMEERAVQRAKQELEPKLEEERHSRWQEQETPRIKAKGNEIYQKLASSALPDEVTAAIAERTKGVTDPNDYRARVQEVQKEFAVEFEVAQAVVNAATETIEEFYALSTKRPGSEQSLRSLRPEAEIFDPATGRRVPNLASSDPEVRRQASVLKMVEDVGADFKANGGAELKKDGKWFVTRDEWYGMAPEQRGPFWTFTNEEIVARAIRNVKPAIQHLIRQRDEQLAALGYKRQRPQAAAPAASAQAAPVGGYNAPPAPRPTPPPAGPTTPAQTMGQSLASRLLNQPKG